MTAAFNRLCPDCGAYLARASSCRRCSNTGGTRTRTNRAYAQNLRTPLATRTPPPSRNPAAADPLTGQVIREQETWTGRAGGTTTLILLGIGVPLALALLAERTSATGAARGLLAALLIPFAILVLISALIGRRGRFLHRAARNSLAVGAGIGGYTMTHRRGRGAPGRVLIVRSPGRDTRVLVARDLDIPIGSTVHVRGPSIGGYRQAWKVRVDGLDDRWFLTRGVAGAVFCVAFGGIATTIELISLMAR